MSQKLKRLTKKEIESGNVSLPKVLEFLRDVKFSAVFQRNIRDKPKWYVEVRRTTLKNLVEASSKLEETLSAKKSLEDELDALKKYAALLEHNNNQIMTNKQNRHQNNVVPSPGNYINAAIRHGTNLSSKPFQGGLTGLNKK
jgi:hypothetical protein